MAQLISIDGTVTKVAPKNGEAFSLEELQTMVGGYIEFLRLEDGRMMCLNEEGKLKGMVMNAAASGVAYGVLLPGDFVVGPAVVMTAVEAGDPEQL